MREHLTDHSHTGKSLFFSGETFHLIKTFVLFCHAHVSPSKHAARPYLHCVT